MLALRSSVSQGKTGSTKTHEAESLGVQFRVVSWIVLVEWETAGALRLLALLDCLTVAALGDSIASELAHGHRLEKTL